MARVYGETESEVRKLYTVGGVRILGLDDLQHGGAYVATGYETFKKLDYCGKSPRPQPQEDKEEKIKPVEAAAVHKKRKIEFCSINVFANGEALVPAVQVKIPQYALKNMGTILTMVTEKMCLRTAVNRLYTLDGHPVEDPTELKNNEHYVAVSWGKFRPLAYGQEVSPSCNTTSRNERKDTTPAVGTPRRAQNMRADAGCKEVTKVTPRDRINKANSKVEGPQQQGKGSRMPVAPSAKGSLPAGRCSVPVTKTQKPQKKEIKPVVQGKAEVTGHQQRKHTFFTINVFANGEVRVPAVQVRIPQFALKNMGTILTMVMEKMCLRTAVKRLYTLDGHPVEDPTELKTNEHYVALSWGKFSPLAYGQEVSPSCNTTSRNERKDATPAVGTPRRAHNMVADGGCKEVTKVTPRDRINKANSKLEGPQQQGKGSRMPVTPSAKGSLPAGRCSVPVTKTQKPQKKEIKPVVQGKAEVTGHQQRKHTFFTINVFANGEVRVPAVQVRIPQFALKNMGTILTMVMEKMCLRTAVKRLYTLDGHPVEDPTELKTNEHYVALSWGKFSPLAYGQEVSPSCNTTSRNERKDTTPAVGTPRRAQNMRADAGCKEVTKVTPRDRINKAYSKLEGPQQQRKGPRIPVSPSAKGSLPAGRCSVPATKTQKPQKKEIKPVVQGKAEVTGHQQRKHTFFTINVFANGEVRVPAVQVRIPQFALKNMGTILTMVMEKMCLRTAVKRLYTLDGHPVEDPTELKNHEHYVALSWGKFRPLAYGQESCKTTSRNERKDTTPAVGTTHHAQNMRADAGCEEVIEVTPRDSIQEGPQQQRQGFSIPVAPSAKGDGSSSCSVPATDNCRNTPKPQTEEIEPIVLENTEVTRYQERKHETCEIKVCTTVALVHIRVPMYMMKWLDTAVTMMANQMHLDAEMIWHDGRMIQLLIQVKTNEDFMAASRGNCKVLEYSQQVETSCKKNSEDERENSPPAVQAVLHAEEVCADAGVDTAVEEDLNHDIVKLEEPKQKPTRLIRDPSGDVACKQDNKLLIQVLESCSVVYDFVSVSVSSLAKKADKEMMLQDLVRFFIINRSSLSKSIYSEVVNMYAANVFRTLPPASTPTDPYVHAEDNQPVFEPAWPHLELVGNVFLAFLQSRKFEPDKGKKYIGRRFIIHLLEQFQSEDPRQRELLKMILFSIYTKIVELREFIIQKISHTFCRFIYENEQPNGISELLEILGSIILELAPRFSEDIKTILIKVLMPLHKMRSLAVYYEALVYCILGLVCNDSTLLEQVVLSLLRYWPKTNVRKEMMFIVELQDIFGEVDPSEFVKVQEPLFRQLAKCVLSLSSEVAEKALTLWNCEPVTDLIRANAATLTPIMLPALYKSSKTQQKGSLQKLIQKAVKPFIEMDPKLLEECAENLREEQNKEQERSNKRREAWIKIENLAKANAKHD